MWGMQVSEDTYNGCLRPVLNRRKHLLVFSAPPAAVQVLPGSQGETFDPEEPGAAYMVVKKKKKQKGVVGVIQTNNCDAKWTLNPESSPVSETSQPSMKMVPCGYKRRGKNPAPAMGPYTPYKFWLDESGFLFSEPAGKKPRQHASPPLLPLPLSVGAT